jgi:hypothetical protein
MKDALERYLLKAVLTELEKKNSCSFEPIKDAIEKKKREREDALVHRFSKMFVNKAPDYLSKDEPDKRTKVIENLITLLGGSRYSSHSQPVDLTVEYIDEELKRLYILIEKSEELKTHKEQS